MESTLFKVTTFGIMNPEVDGDKMKDFTVNSWPKTACPVSPNTAYVEKTLIIFAVK